MQSSDTEPRPRKRTPSLAKRLWSKVTYGPGCWTWQRANDGRGYGVIGTGVGNGVDKAHRVAYRLAKGPIPAGMGILHSCDNPACVRPDHLRPGTQRENARDMVERGRHYTPFKTHRYVRPKSPTCVHGHAFDEANTTIGADGSRNCRACRRAISARYRQRRAEAS